MKRRTPKETPSVAARFDEVADVVRFFDRLGMPASLVNQLTAWLRGLEPGEAEEMEPELQWEGRPTRMQIAAVVDDNDSANVEFRGPVTLVAEIQDELDAFFAPQRGGGMGKKSSSGDDEARPSGGRKKQDK